MMKKTLMAACLALAAAPAQAGSKVELELRHRATSDWRLGTVVVSSQGRCAEQLAPGITRALARHGVTAGPVDLPRLAYEHGLRFPTFLGAAEVKALGKHVEADTLFLLTTTTCTFPERSFRHGHPRNWLGIEDKSALEYTTTTRSSVAVTLQLLDLKAGRISTPLALQATPEVVEKSREGYPAGPPLEAVQDEALGRIAAQVEALFFDWTEKRELVFYDDKDCNLKAAYQTLKAGNVQAALELSRKNREQCQADPRAKEKHRVRALHNLATALAAAGDHEGALPIYEEALRLGGGDEQRQALESSRAQLRLRDSIKQLDQKIAAAALVPRY